MNEFKLHFDTRTSSSVKFLLKTTFIELYFSSLFFLCSFDDYSKAELKAF